MRTLRKRITASLLAALLLFGSLPVSALAAGKNMSNLKDAGLSIVTNEESALAPGVTMNEVVAYDKNGDRVEMYVTTADTAVDTVEFYANYKDNQNQEYGLQTLSEQVAAMEANYEEPFKVVAGINASYYNTSTGKPTGAFVMEGIDVTTESEGNKYSFFAVLNDGTVMIGDAGTYSDYKGKIKEAIGGYVHIVKDGQVVSGLDKVTKYPRQTIGLTKDGKVIIMTADGSQVPKTIGLTYQEQAEVMLALGCEDALHLDGGNSATFGGVREGGENFELINTPSGSVERAVSNTLMIVSTAISDGTFDHAAISGAYEYFVPYSAFTFEAAGIDAAGGPAKIPEDITWGLSDDSFGSVSNGTFTSSGKLGDVEVQMEYRGEVVGTKTIHVVHPTAVHFDAKEKTVPYGKSSELAITAMYNLNEIYCSPEAFDMNVTVEDAGRLDGFHFTATTDDSISGTVVEASYKYDESFAPISVTVNFGKGSEVIYDFEDKDVSEWIGIDKIDGWITEENKKYPDAKYKILPPAETGNGNGTKSSTTFLGTKENGGQVKNGEASLGLTFDRKYDKDVGGWSYNYMYYIGEPQVWRDAANGKNATKIGMWMYLPKEAAGLYGRICRTFTKPGSDKLYTNYDYLMIDGTKFSQYTKIPEGGWVYAEFDLTDYDYQSSLQYNPNEDYAINNGKDAKGNYYPAFLQFFVNTYDMEAEEVTIYIDDITLDYSDVTEDRDAPVISSPMVSESVDHYVELNGQILSNNSLSFSAQIADVTDTNNYTGLDYSKAKIYLDGVDMSGTKTFKASGNTIALTDVSLINGKHEIVFEIADKQNNYTKLTKTFTVDGPADNSLIEITGHNDGNEIPKAGSVYYIDITASDAAQIESLETTLKLQTANTFEYDQIITADGVSVTYDYEERNHKLSLKLVNNGNAAGKTILASIPVRVWSWSEEATGITAEKQWSTTDTPIVKIQCESVFGQVKFKENRVGKEYYTGFYGNVDLATEVDDKTKWHVHAETELENLAPSCEHDGYTGRTYCEGCHSVLKWGTALEGKHAYAMNENGMYGCMNCGEIYENYTGVFFDEKEQAYRYAKMGVVTGGWALIDEEWYYFDPVEKKAKAGEETIGVITYQFEENGKLVSGVWAKTLFGFRYYYGPSYYSKGWYNIDGKDYYFENGLRLEDGYQLILSIDNTRTWYYFDENGVCDKETEIPDGFYRDRNGYGYSENGQGFTGLQLIDGIYYYFDHKGYAQSGSYAGRIFGDDYKAVTGLKEIEGVLYYYENGITGPCGLVKVGDSYYYSYWGGVIKTSGTYYVGTSYCDLPAGEYEFGPDGKMIIKTEEIIPDGIVEKDGSLLLYQNGKTASYGLYKVDGAYYYSYWGGVVKTGKQYVGTSYCDLPAGEYEFGSDGKMLDGVVEKDGNLVLYKKGKTETYGLHKVNGAYYYSYWSGILKTGKQYVGTSYCDLPAGEYEFGPDGKMYNGIVEREDRLYLYQNGKTATYGLFQVDGNYYFSFWGGRIMTGLGYVGTSYCDLPGGQYEFGSDGKMLQGIVEKDGEMYFYENGKTAACGLHKADGAYYDVYWGGVIKTGTQYVKNTYCDLPAGEYEFGPDGKMYDGIVEKDGDFYLYENGKTSAPGLYEVDGSYYFADWGGILIRNRTYYVWETNGLSIKCNYTFDAAGRIIK